MIDVDRGVGALGSPYRPHSRRSGRRKGLNHRGPASFETLEQRVLLASMFDVVDLRFGSTDDSQAVDINQSGTVLLNEDVDLGGPTEIRPYVADELARSPVKTPIAEGTGETRRGTGLNDSDQVIGTYFPSTGSSPLGFLTDLVGDTSSPINFSGPTEAADINDSGQFVGALVADGSVSYVAFDGSNATQIGSLPGASEGYTNAISDVGFVVGLALIDGGSHGFLFRDVNGNEARDTLPTDEMIDLIPLPGGSFSEAFDVNDSGLAVGYAEWDTGSVTPFATTWQDFTDDGVIQSFEVTSLGQLPGDDFSMASGVNENNVVVGMGDNTIPTSGDHRRGFIARSLFGFNVVDLNTLIDPSENVTIVDAVAVNNRYQIAATAVDNTTSQEFAVRLDPREMAFIDGNTLVVIGSDGDDDIQIDPDGSEGNILVTINGMAFQFGSNVEDVEVYGLDGDDDITVHSSQFGSGGSGGTQIQVDGGAGGDDTLFMHSRGDEAFNVANDTVQNNWADVSFANAETLAFEVGSTQGADQITIDKNAAINSIVIQNDQDNPVHTIVMGSSTNDQFDVTSNALSMPRVGNPLVTSWNEIDSLTLFGQDGDDDFNLDGFQQPTTLFGGPPSMSDTVTVFDSPIDDEFDLVGREIIHNENVATLIEIEHVTIDMSDDGLDGTLIEANFLAAPEGVTVTGGGVGSDSLAVIGSDDGETLTIDDSTLTLTSKTPDGPDTFTDSFAVPTSQFGAQIDGSIIQTEVVGALQVYNPSLVSDVIRGSDSANVPLPGNAVFTDLQIGVVVNMLTGSNEPTIFGFPFGTGLVAFNNLNDTPAIGNINLYSSAVQVDIPGETSQFLNFMPTMSQLGGASNQTLPIMNIPIPPSSSGGRADFIVDFTTESTPVGTPADLMPYLGTESAHVYIEDQGAGISVPFVSGVQRALRQPSYDADLDVFYTWTTPGQTPLLIDHSDLDLISVETLGGDDDANIELSPTATNIDLDLGAPNSGSDHVTVQGTAGVDDITLRDDVVDDGNSIVTLKHVEHIVVDISDDGPDTVTVEQTFRGAPGSIEIQGGGTGQDELIVNSTHVDQEVFVDDSIVDVSENPPGFFTEIEIETGGTASFVNGFSPIGISPDGKHVYGFDSFTGTGDRLGIYERDAATGELTFLNDLAVNSDSAMTFSADGAYVYTNQGNGVRVYERDTDTGDLTQIQSLPVANHFGTGDIDISPDGRWVFASAGIDETIHVHAVDPDDGTLTPMSFVEDGVNGVVLQSAGDIEVSPDGGYLYAADSIGDSVSVYSIDTVTGALTQQQMLTNLGTGGNDLDNPLALVVAPDGRDVYVVSNLSDALTHFTRDGGTGLLTFADSYVDGDVGVDGLDFVRDVTVAPNGNTVYTGSLLDSAVAAFLRDPVDGSLTQIGLGQDPDDTGAIPGATPIDGLENNLFIDMPPGGRHLYANQRDIPGVTVIGLPLELVIDHSGLDLVSVNTGDGDDNAFVKLSATGPDVQLNLEAPLLGSDTLTIEATEGSDNIDIVSTTITGIGLNSVDYTDIEEVTINTLGGNDLVSIDMDTMPVPTDGLTINGGGQFTGGDTVQLFGGTFTNIDHTLSMPFEGVADLDGEIINYNDVEFLQDTNSADSRLFSTFVVGFPASTYRLADTGATNDGLALFDNDPIAPLDIQFVNYTFEVPTTSLDIETSLGSDTITVEPLDTNWAGDLTVMSFDGDDLIDASTYDLDINIGTDLGNDTVMGGLGDDTIDGGEDDDELHGGPGNDTITGGLGNDMIFGDEDDDDLRGGQDDDTYFLLDGWGTDLITNETSGDDTLDASGVAVPLDVTTGSVILDDGVNSLTHAANDVENVLLGSANDTVLVGDGTSLTLIDGGPGIDRLDYSTYTSPVVIDLNNDIATGFGTASNFESLTVASDAITVSVNTPLLVVSGSNANDRFILTESTPNAIRLRETNSGFDQTFAGIEGVIINAQDGDDRLTVDYAAGEFSLTSGITYNGGSNATANGDDLIIDESSGDDLTTFGFADYTFTTQTPDGNDGTIDLQSINGLTINYTGLEPIFHKVDTANFTFNLPDLGEGSNDAQLRAGFDAGTNELLGDSFETVVFPNPLTSMVFNLSEQGDLFEVRSLDDGFDSGAFFQINGGTDNDFLTGPLMEEVDWQLTGTGDGSGEVNDGEDYTIDFTGIERITGGQEDDLFIFDDGVDFGGFLDGGPHSTGDVLDYTNYTTAADADLPGGTATGTTGIANIEGVIGVPIRWIGDGAPGGDDSGMFGDPTKWSTGVVPGPGDDVFIDLDGTYTVTVEFGPPVQIETLRVGAANGVPTLLIEEAAALTVDGLTQITRTDATNFGRVHVLGGTLTLDGNATVDGELDVEAAPETLDGLGLVTVQTEGVLTVTDSNVDSDVTNLGTIIAKGLSNFSGLIANQLNAMIMIDGNGGDANEADVTFDQGFVNDGTIELTDTSATSQDVILTIDSGTLVNTANGVITATDPVNIGGFAERQLHGQLTHQGLIADTDTNVSLTILNAGTTFDATTGAFNDTGPIVTVEDGDVELGTGTQFLGDAAPVFTAVTESQNVQLVSDVTVDVPAGITFRGTGGNQVGVVGPGQLFVDAFATLDGGTFIDALIDVTGRLAVTGTDNTINSTYVSQVGSILQVGPNSGTLAADIEFANDMTNNGLIDLRSTTSGAPRVLTVNGILTNSTTGDIETNNSGVTIPQLVAEVINNGTVTPDDADLRVIGDFTQTSTGSLNMSIDDPADFDNLHVTGQFTPGGALNVSYNDPAPAPPESFSIIQFLTFGGGDFDTTTGLNPAPGLELTKRYEPTALFLDLAIIPTVTQTDDLLTIVGTDENDSIILSSPSANAIRIQITSHGIDQTFSGINQVDLDTGLGDDSLTVNFGEGDIVLPGGINYDAGGEATPSVLGDVLTVSNNLVTFDTATFNYFEAGPDGNEGEVVLGDGSENLTISYTGLEPLFTGLDVDHVVFNLPDVSEDPNFDVELRNAGSPGISELSGSTFEDTQFANPNESLTINLGGEGDTISIVDADPGLGVPVDIFGGSGSDTVIGQAMDTDWFLLGLGSGDAFGQSTGAVFFTFENIETLVGNNNDDNFTFDTDANFGGDLKGDPGPTNTGFDTLDYTNYSDTPSVDLIGGTADGTTGIMFFDDVVLPEPDDTDPPDVSAMVDDRATTGTDAQPITVDVTDDIDLDESSLDDNDLLVFGPGSTVFSVDFDDFDSEADEAAYLFDPPGGSWGFEDNGVYTVELVDGEICDEAGNCTPNQVLTTFTVNIPNPLVVTNTNNSGLGSLRDAILAANAMPGLDTITFNIPGAGPHTIAPTSALPQITDAVFIDGYSQPGADPNTNDTSQGLNSDIRIVLDGTSAGFTEGLTINADNSTIHGLSIGNFATIGVQVLGDGNSIGGSFIGVAPDGVTAMPNGAQGIVVFGGFGNMIGGDGMSAPEEGRNLISGNNGAGVLLINSQITLIYGNLIGTTADGLGDLGNGAEGVLIDGGSNNTIGGTQAMHRNVISGNTLDGVNHFNGATGNFVSGNYIGLNVSGTVAIANDRDGVRFDGAPGNTVGGMTPTPGTAAGNVISGNDRFGIFAVNSSDNTTVQGNIIGLNAAGNGAAGNASHAVFILRSDSAQIGGDASTGARNVISANAFDAVQLEDAQSNIIQGNFIGTDIGGTLDFGNGDEGVAITDGSNNNTVGGLNHNLSNVIGFNLGDGVQVEDSDSNQVLHNLIGTDLNGTLDLGNARGVRIENGLSNTVDGNVISGNQGDGAVILGPVAQGNTLTNNFIGTNAAGDMALPNGGSGVVLADGASGNHVGQAENGNVFSGNGQNGVLVTDFGTDGNTVESNLIGTDASGTQPLGNALDGVLIVNDAAQTTVVDNVIADSGQEAVEVHGVDGGEGGMGLGAGQGDIGGAVGGGLGGGLGGGAASSTGGGFGGSASSSTGGGLGSLTINGFGNDISNNYIGTDRTGTLDLGNASHGVLLLNGAADNNIADNVIAFNGGDAVSLLSTAGQSNSILLGATFSNVGQPIDLNNDGVTANDGDDSDVGPNLLQNFPNVSSAFPGSTIVSGTLNSAITTAYTLDFYASSGANNAERLLGSTVVVTDGTGLATFTDVVLAGNVVPGEFVRATATDPNGNTSELSTAVTVVEPEPEEQDEEGPTVDSASLPAAITAESVASQQIEVVFVDATAVDPSSIDTGDIMVSGPNGPVNVSSVFVAEGLTPGSPRTAVFTITPTGGAWDMADNGTYSVSLVAGAVSDTLGNVSDSASLGSFVVNIAAAPDPNAPSATAQTNDINTPGGAFVDFMVSYSDDVAVDVATLGSGDVAVRDPSGELHAVSFLGVDLATNGSPRTATYRLAAPGGLFDAADNGLYTVVLNFRQVFDTSDNPAAPGDLETFQVNIADTTSPVASGSADDINIGGALTHTLTVVFTDDVAVDVSSLDNIDVSVSGPGGVNLPARFVGIDFANNGSPRTVTYEIDAPRAPTNGFGPPDDGVYQINMNAGQVVDTSGNAIATGAIGTFTVATTNQELIEVVNGVLTIIGSPGNDTIALLPPPPGSNPGTVRVVIQPLGFDQLFGGVTSYDINAIGGDDVVTVDPNLIDSGSGPLGGVINASEGDDTMTGGPGPDLFIIGPSAGADVINGGLGLNAVQVNGDGGDDDVLLTGPSTLIFNGNATTLNNIDEVDVDLSGDGTDSAQVDASFNIGDVEVTGGGTGTDTLIVNDDAGASQNIDVLGGLINVTGGPNAQSIAHTGFDVLNINTDGGDDSVLITTNDVPDNVNVDSGGDDDLVRIEGTPGDDTFDVDTDNVVIGSTTVGLGPGLQLTLAGLDGDDVYRLHDGWYSHAIDEQPGEGNDTLEGSNVTTDIQFDIASLTATSGFSVATDAPGTVENAIGGSGDDTVVFADGASVAGTLDGGPGVDTLDYSAYTTPLFVNLATGVATGTAGVSNFEDLVGVGPTPTLQADDVTQFGTDVVLLTVTYTGAGSPIDVSTIGAGDIAVQTPGGATFAPSLIGVNLLSDGDVRVATYAFNAPGGSGEFEDSDNGTYTVLMNPGQVLDQLGNAARDGAFGTFDVAVNGQRPTSTPDSDDVTAPGTTHTFNVIYHDEDGAVDVTSFGDDDIVVTSPGLAYAQFATFVGIEDASDDGRTVTAQYRIVARGGIWTADDNGVYRINVVGDVADDEGNTAAKTLIGLFRVKVAPADSPATTNLQGSFDGLPPDAVLRPGDRGSVDLKITNDGPQVLNDSLRIELFASADGVIGEGDVPVGLVIRRFNLGVGQMQTVRVNFQIPNDLIGEVQLLALIDTTDAAVETDEDDNVVVDDDMFMVDNRFGEVDGSRARLTLVDADGTLITFNLNKGTGHVVETPEGFNVIVDDTTDTSALTIQARGGDGKADIHDITVNGPLRTLNARRSRIHGDVLIAGTTNLLILDDVADVHTVAIGPGDPNDTVAIIGGNWSDTDLNSQTPVRSLRLVEADNVDVTVDGEIRSALVKNWNTGSINAERVDRLISNGNPTQGLGGLNLNVNLTGPAATNGRTLGLVNARGPIDGTWVVQNGDVGPFSSGSVAPTFSGSFEGDVLNVTIRGDLAGALAAAAFRNVNIRGNAIGALIHAGAFFGPDGVLGGGDDVFSPGSIQSLRVTGGVIDTIIGAGVDPVDSVLNNGNDVLLSPSEIKSISVGGLTNSLIAASTLPDVARVNNVNIATDGDPRFLSS